MKNAFINADSVLTSWGYAEANGTDTKVEVADDFNLEPGAWKLSGSDWVAYAAPLTVASCEAALQAELDAGAQAWGYDSVISAASYASSSNPQFKAEALAQIERRDATWAWAAQELAAFQGGTQTMPSSTAAFVALMPVRPARPTAS